MRDSLGCLIITWVTLKVVIYSLLSSIVKFEFTPPLVSELNAWDSALCCRSSMVIVECLRNRKSSHVSHM